MKNNLATYAPSWREKVIFGAKQKQPRHILAKLARIDNPIVLRIE